MANRKTPSSTAVRIRRLLKAPRVRVFRAWTDAELMARWFSPRPEVALSSAEVDARPGGRLRIVLRMPSGETHAVHGVYREVKEPERLAFTWVWEGKAPCEGEEPCDLRETLVTVEFHEAGTGTELLLTHELYQDREDPAKHSGAWEGCLANLEVCLEEGM